MYNFLKNKLLVDKYIKQKSIKKLCLAPEKSLRFTHSGNVLSCCFNRGNILGNIKNESLHDIWFGKKTIAFQKAIKSKNLTRGCQTCAYNIYNNNFEAVAANQYDYLKNQESLNGYPTMLDFEISSQCNLECIMCSGEYSSAIRINREKNKPYHSPYDEKFVEELTEFLPHLKEARFVGGEPFLIKLHFKIWEKIIEINPAINVTVLSNGTTLTNKIKSILEKGDFTMSISIDGITKEVYEKIRINASYEEVMENIAYFKKYNESKGRHLIFNVCAMRQNYHDLPKMVNYCNENNIELVLHTVFFPSDCSLWKLDIKKLTEILKLYKGLVFVNHTDLAKKNNSTFKGLIGQIESFIAKKNSPELLINKTLNKEQGLELLENNIKVYCKKANYANADNQLTMLYELLAIFTIKEQEKIIHFFNELPIHLFVSELTITDKERMYERFKLIVNERDV